jgi:hypothetical protein
VTASRCADESPFSVHRDAGCGRHRGWLRWRELLPPIGLARLADRCVTVSVAVKDVLERLKAARQEKALAHGAEVSAWVFAMDAGTPFDHGRVGKVFKWVLKAAKLPLHYSPHSLRHTFASLLLQQAESPAYVQRQLGHASIKLTVDTYGRWLPMGNKAAVDRLDEGFVTPDDAVGRWNEAAGHPHSVVAVWPNGASTRSMPWEEASRGACGRRPGES